MTVAADLAVSWRSLLEWNQFVVWPDETTYQRQPEIPHRIVEKLWRVRDVTCDVSILERQNLDRDDGKVFLVSLSDPTDQQFE